MRLWIEKNKEYENIGDIPAIILHGLFGSGSNWHTIARQLKVPTLCPDLANHGTSPHTEEVDYGTMADDVIETMDILKIDRAVLIGHSMGGKVAMNCALRYPHRCAGLIIIDIAPVRYMHDHSNIFNAMRAVVDTPIKSRRHADEIMAQFVPERSVRAFLLKNLVAAPTRERPSEQSTEFDTREHYVWRLNWRAIAKNYWKLREWSVQYNDSSPQEFKGRVFAIAGETSIYLPPQYWENITALFPTAQIVSIPHTGHWVHVEAPEKTVELLNDMITQSISSTHS